MSVNEGEPSTLQEEIETKQKKLNISTLSPQNVTCQKAFWQATTKTEKKRYGL